MKWIKTYESWSNVIPVGTKIEFCGKECQIIDHKSNWHNEVFYLIRYLNGEEEFVASGDKRIENL